MKQHRVSAPANLLVLGEYAVLEEGGLGLAVAPDIRVTGSSGAADGLPAGRLARSSGPRITGVIPGETIRWPGDTGLLGRAADFLLKHHPLATGSPDIELDSRAFFDAHGNKLGFGSSAAVTVALTALWLALIDRASDVAPVDSDDVFAVALATHRAGQGGGSGYDVAASTYGGTILFSGGHKPAVTRVDLPWLPELGLVHGRAPVQTISAVSRYRDWKSEHQADALDYVDSSNRLIRDFIAAADWSTAREILVACSELAIELGRQIGVSAELEGINLHDRERNVFAKAVGAGNELGLVFGASRLRPITIAETGVSWQ